MKVLHKRNLFPGPQVCHDAGTALISGRFARGLAVLAVLGVLAVFLFPSVQGPYSVVHGPVTVMHAARSAAGLRMAVQRAGLNCLGYHVSAAIVLMSFAAPHSVEFQSSALPTGTSTALRC